MISFLTAFSIIESAFSSAEMSSARQWARASRMLIWLTRNERRRLSLHNKKILVMSFEWVWFYISVIVIIDWLLLFDLCETSSIASSFNMNILVRFVFVMNVFAISVISKIRRSWESISLTRLEIWKTDCIS